MNATSRFLPSLMIKTSCKTPPLLVHKRRMTRKCADFPSSMDAQTYAKQLLVKRHGYPLWIPEPYGHSAIYRTKGVRIGDVGYVTDDGGFETLFNIRASQDHPINRRGVPDGFEQVHLDADDIVHLADFHHPNSAVTSTSAQQRSMGAGLSATQTQ